MFDPAIEAATSRIILEQPNQRNVSRTEMPATWRALALNVLTIEEGVITEILLFMPDLFPAFGLPVTLDGPSPRKRVFDSSEKESA